MIFRFSLAIILYHKESQLSISFYKKSYALKIQEVFAITMAVAVAIEEASK